MSFWDKLKHAAVAVGHAFVHIFGKDAAEKFKDGALALLKTSAGKIALDAVESVESLADPNATGSAKRESAFNKIIADFENQGIAVESGTVNLLIETAVAALKARIIEPLNLPKPAPPATDTTAQP